MFSRGDTTYRRPGGEIVCKQRSTSIRYLAEEARKRAVFSETEEPDWSAEELAALDERRRAYQESFLALGHGARTGVAPGQPLPARPIGPHSIASFTTEWRAFLMSVWGTFREDGGPSSLHQSGWLPEMARDLDGAKRDPTLADGLYHGPSRGHVQQQYAQRIGMPRGYGYGASMGAWILDYLANWVGEHGWIVHSDAKFRSPALTGDVSWLHGTVRDVVERGRIAVIDVTMTNQREEVLAKASAEVRLPDA
jgi:hypothetical protein